MIVRLVAHTVVIDEGLMEAGWISNLGGQDPSDTLAEFAGRLCYQSWTRPNPTTATNGGYLANILTQAHYSVLEHASASFYIADVSRSLSHELVRHRHLSFSQVSQRYVDESGARFVPNLALERAARDRGIDLAHLATQVQSVYVQVHDALMAAGFSRKEARQAARAVLPNATETKMIVTGNMRAWRDVIQKRNHPAADTEIRALAQEILRILKELAPNTFQDME